MLSPDQGENTLPKQLHSIPPENVKMLKEFYTL